MYMCKRFYILVLTVLSLASCSKEVTVGDVDVQFNAVVSPEMTVLVKGDEPQTETVVANHAVLQAWRDGVKAAESVQSIESGATHIFFNGIKLAGGATYLIYIWVDCAGYYNTDDLRSVSVKEDKFFNGKNAEFDAFYSCTTVTCGQNDEVHQVTLTRPFAKVSFSAAVEQNVTISYKAPTTLNLKTGAVSGEKPVSYTATHGVSSVAAFDYVFATEAVSQLSYTFKLGSEEAKTTSVPVKRNTKTNIIYNATN